MDHILVVILARFLETLFVAGSIGSAVVLVLSGIEDLKTLFGGEEEHHS
jgi:hypothetical protein